MKEAQLSRWLKNEGEEVALGEPLLQVTTDKVSAELDSLHGGVLRKIFVHEGELANVGQTLAIIGEPDEDISALISQFGSVPPRRPQHRNWIKSLLSFRK
jgi:pyruvate dehydrogenase E2 component (dihydrolipoamide acetyltransferase)